MTIINTITQLNSERIFKSRPNLIFNEEFYIDNKSIYSKCFVRSFDVVYKAGLNILLHCTLINISINI